MQLYLNPMTIGGADTHWPTKRLKAALERDGQIVPLLVRVTSAGNYQAADITQAERLRALQELGWETILVETEWLPSDL